MVEFMRENGKMIINLEEVMSYIQMAIDMKVFLLMENMKEQALICGLMVKFMMDNGWEEKNMV